MKKLITLLLLFSIESLYAQGYCSLRNPQSKISQLFPNSNHYKTIIATINAQARQEVKQLLPFTLHYYELGRHNLYLIYRDNKTAGVVHARTEESKWGLIEIVWSFNLDLSIKDFTFQRCRSRNKSDLLDSKFKQQIIGLSFQDLLKLIANDGQVNKELLINEQSKELAQIVVQSALKTIALTSLCWSDKLNKLRGMPDFDQINSLKTADSINIKIISKEKINYFQAYLTDEPKSIVWGVVQQGQINAYYSPISTTLNTQQIEQIKRQVAHSLKALK